MTLPNERPRVGLLLIGLNGANGTAISGAVSSLKNDSKINFGISSLPIFDQSHFPLTSDFVLSGWDVRGATNDRLVPGEAARGIWSSADSALGDEDKVVEWTQARDVIATLVAQILEFQELNSLNHITVVNLSSPPRRMRRPLAEASVEDILSGDPGVIPSSVLYAWAAIEAGCNYVDFTPSETLEWPHLHKLAIDHAVQTAGRDASTGQTFLKLLISAALQMRGLPVVSWYSTNILGNRDGAVLVLPGVDETKQADKAYGLSSITGLSAPNHQVDIRYFPELGDYKEAWDSVLSRDFLGNDVEIRINWKAKDSPIAAQLCLDLVRFVAAGSGEAVGLRKDLALYFKHPMGAIPRSPMKQFDQLIEANPQLLKVGASRLDLPW